MNIPNIGSCMQLHNHFNVVVKDARTGQIKQKAKAYNVVLDRFYTNVYSSEYKNFNFIQLGTGTGQPRSTDTALFNRKYTLTGTPSRKIISPSTLQFTLVATSPVGNTGDFTEVGFGNTGYLISHALFTDSEDNPIVITQTETDVLEITAIAFITLEVSDTLFKYPTYPAKVIDAQFGTPNFTNSIIPTRLGIGLATAVTANDDEQSNRFFSMHGLYAALGNASGVNLASTAIAKNTIVRAGVSVGNLGFFNYLVMGLSTGDSLYTVPYPFCYIKFPNAAVFPLYTIEKLPVGIGDGTRTIFNCPLDMFVKDSDVVRVNGVQLTRDVDYTIDHHSNHSNSINITPGCIAVCKSDMGVRADLPTRYKMFAPSIAHSSPEPYCVFSHNAPLYIELDDADETIGTTVNYVTLGGMRPISSQYNHAMQRAVFTLEYSTDGVNYSPATSMVSEGTFSSVKTLEFPSVTTKYWRLSVDVTNCELYATGVVTKDTPIVQVVGGATFLGYKGTGIKFVTPPATGDTIEMDVTIDRPYKSVDYVIDLAGNFTITH